MTTADDAQWQWMTSTTMNNTTATRRHSLVQARGEFYFLSVFFFLKKTILYYK